METPKLLKKYVQMILTQQYGITPDKFKNLMNTGPKQSLAELLTTQGLLTKKQFLQVVQEAKQKVREFKASNKPRLEIPPTKQMPPPVFDATEKILSTQVPTVKRIGKYEIIKKIAQGGMGAVYQARHIELDQIYALKLILEGAHATPDTIARFHREAKISAKLKHPGIVQVVDSGEENGQHYFCMEYVEGESLSAKIQEGLSLNAGIELIRKTLEALEYAHRQGILHRDLKPGNIFVTASGDPKIGDFGLAKDQALGQQNPQLTQSGEILGPPAYMPPEQASGAIAELNESADVYAIGACLYQVVTGRCPFEGKTLHELFYKIISEEAKREKLFLESRLAEICFEKNNDKKEKKGEIKEAIKDYTSAIKIQGEYKGYGSEEAIDPRNKGLGSFRVSRGGGWDIFASFCRSSYRAWYDPGFRIFSIGFRVCKPYP